MQLVSIKQHRIWKLILTIIYISSVCTFPVSLSLAQEKAPDPVFRNIVRNLKHIPAEDAKKMLVGLGLGQSVNQLPNSNALIITTANSSDSQKAVSLLNLIDSKESFVVTTLVVSPDPQKIPTNEQIAKKIDNIYIGTFADPPIGVNQPLAIVDLHNSNLVAVATKSSLEIISKEIDKLYVRPRSVKTSKPAEQKETQMPLTLLERIERIRNTTKSTSTDFETPEKKASPAGKDVLEAELFESLTKAGEKPVKKPIQKPVEKPKQPKTDHDEVLESLKALVAQSDVKTEQTKEVEIPLTVPAEKNQTQPIQQAAKSPQGPAKDDQAEILEALKALSAQSAAKAEQIKEVKKPLPVTDETFQTRPAQPVTESPQVPSKDEQAQIKKALERLNAKMPQAQTKKKIYSETVTAGQPVEPLQPKPQPDIPKPVPEPVLVDLPLSEKELETILTLPEEIELTDLITLVGEQLKLNYMYDSATLKNKKITLRLHEGKVKVKVLYSLLVEALMDKGFIMVRHGSFVVIKDKKDAMAQDPKLRTPDEPIQTGDIIVNTIFTLKHISTDTAIQLLKDMSLGLNYEAIPASKTLIVQGYTHRMPLMQRLLEMIDIPGEARQFRFRPLKYTLAVNLAQKVKTLAEELGTVEVTVSKTAQAAKPSTATSSTRLTTKEKQAKAARERQERQQKAASKAKPGQTKPEKGVYLDTDERTNRILIVGLQKDIDLVNALIDTLDVEQQDLRAIKLYEIQMISAEEAENYLFQLDIISKTSATGRRGTSSRGRSTPTRSQTAQTSKGQTPRQTSRGQTEQSAGEEEMAQVVVLEATNSLLVNATPQQHDQIAMIISYVDAEFDKTTIPYVVYAIENQDPEKLVDTLDQLIKETTKTTTKEGSSKITAVPRKEDEDIIRIVFDENTYSLIVYADKKNQQWIGALITELDQYRPQVLLDVTLVEVTKQDDFNYDLNVLASIPDFTNTSGLTGTISGTITAQSIFDKLNTHNYDRNKFIDMQADSGNFTGFYGDKKINALFTAMQTKKYGRVLAKPKLLVDDNQSGSITTSRTTYITRTTSSFQSTQSGDPIQTSDIKFDPFDASIQLDIKPHISKGDNLRLEITLSRSDFVNLELTSEKPPDRTESNVDTVVTVPDGSTIILGGMEKINQGKGGDKVPLLGDIPLVGGLFRSTSNTSTQSKLYIFIKAHILRPGTDLTSTDLIRISKRNRADFEMTEAEMQKYENWPGIKSKPMEPEKILEADDDNIESMDSLQFLEEAQQQSKTTGRQQYFDSDVQKLL